MGEGSYGVVYKGLLDGIEEVAVKMLKVDKRSFTGTHKMAFLKEADLNFRERMSCFVTLHGVIFREGNPCLVLEKNQCSLHNLICGSPQV